MAPLSVTILYNKTNKFGLNDDIIIIEQILKTLQDTIKQPISKPKVLDIREPHIHSDIQIHLEIPVYSAIPWAYTNILLVNPEQWSYSYDSYVHSFDVLLFRDSHSAETFSNDLLNKNILINNYFVIPWCASWNVTDFNLSNTFDKRKLEFVSFLAGSKTKYDYISKLLPHWKENDPFLTIFTTRNDYSDNLNKMNLPSNITISCQDFDKDTQYRLMSSYHGHIVCSSGEAFGYAAANAEVAGAFTIMNSLPTFAEHYQYIDGISWISNLYTKSTQTRYSFASPSDNIRQELENAFTLFHQSNFKDIFQTRHKYANNRFTSTCNSFLPVLELVQKLVKERKPSKGIQHFPPVLDINDCPPITIITPTYNRKNFIDIAFHNLLITDYPHSKIEWIVIEDNEKKHNMASDKIIKFQMEAPSIKLKYIPIEGRMSIGQKRNHAIEHASNDIILFMDDDDHYPTTSFRRRVAWLTKGMKNGQTGKSTIACCTTLALYDLKHGTSAINVPPYDIPFSQRISEATLTFKKSAWLERKFDDISISEGESWINGRETQVIEIPPQQIIVAFSHGNNQSSRRIPPSDTHPSCFWGFPKEYLIFIHKLAGVEVEQSSKKKSSK